MLSKKENYINEVQRAADEFKRALPIFIRDGNANRLILGVENIENGLFERFKKSCDNKYSLILTSNRFKNIDKSYDKTGLVRIWLDSEVTIEDISSLSEKNPSEQGEISHNITSIEQNINADGDIYSSALALGRIAQRVPAILISDENIAPTNDLLCVDSQNISSYEGLVSQKLDFICEAKVTLSGAKSAKIAVFRSFPSGKEHYAFIIGNPARDNPLMRIHSSCFTGDLLQSLLCDCGDQLHGAISFMDKNEGGIIIYLMQEGRAIGLANKLKAYGLKEAGMDTVEANEFLGFDADERPYIDAASILKSMNYTQVQLLTNNPRKIKGLEACGIKVSQRVALISKPHEHNETYLATKSDRLGHYL